jgi:predicted transcriptional regulator
MRITLSDEIAAAVEEKAAYLGRSAADLAAETLSDAFGETDWFYALDDEATAAIREGMADIEGGAVREHEAVFETIRRKHGW